MSETWDSLQDVERHQNEQHFEESVEDHFAPIPERRSTKRVWAYAPILVYGYALDEPFHEGTEALHVNARGGLITLSTTVSPGQALLLMNKINLKEQLCSVLRQESAYMNRVAIVVAFPQTVSDFWCTTCS
jgi:hypothetical protein